MMRRKLFNFRAIAYILGEVLVIEGTALTLALLVCVLYGEGDWVAFAASGAGTFVLGLSLMFFCKPTRTTLSTHDGILITALAWLAITLVGAVPFTLCSHPVGWTDAVFESISGFSTTGASVMRDVEALGKGVNMWRALIQWIGGIGIILFMLTLIPRLDKSGGMHLMAAESSDFVFDKTSPRIMQTARDLWMVYLWLTIACVVLLWIGPMDLYDSIVFSFATISTGGFSPYADSVMHFNSVYVKLVLIVFMFLGGVNFTLMAHARKGNFGPLLHNSTLRSYVGIVLSFLVLFIGSMLLAGCAFSADGMLVDPLFQIVSAISSTGFASAHYEEWGALVFVFFMFLMFCGACSGSTTGGVKVDRMMVLLRNCRNEVSLTVNRNTLYPVKDGDKQLTPQAVGRIVTFVSLFLFTVLAGALWLIGCGIGVDDAFFTSFSCTCNNGLGYGLTGEGGSFALLPASCKWVMSWAMYAGRLELLTVFVLFLPSFWRR